MHRFFPVLVSFTAFLALNAPALAEETLKLLSLQSTPSEIVNGGSWQVQAVVEPLNDGEVDRCWGLFNAPWELSISYLYTDECQVKPLGNGQYGITLRTEFPARSVSYDYRLGAISLKMRGADTAEYVQLDPEYQGVGPSVRVKSSTEAEPLVFRAAQVVTASGRAEISLGETFHLEVRLSKPFNLREGQLLIPVLKDTDLIPGSSAPVLSDAVELRPGFPSTWWNVELSQREEGADTVLVISLTVPKNYSKASMIAFDTIKLVSRELRDLEVQFDDKMPLEIVP